MISQEITYRALATVTLDLLLKVSHRILTRKEKQNPLL